MHVLFRPRTCIAGIANGNSTNENIPNLNYFYVDSCVRYRSYHDGLYRSKDDEIISREAELADRHRLERHIAFERDCDLAQVEQHAAADEAWYAEREAEGGVEKPGRVPLGGEGDVGESRNGNPVAKSDENSGERKDTHTTKQII